MEESVCNNFTSLQVLSGNLSSWPKDCFNSSNHSSSISDNITEVVPDIGGLGKSALMLLAIFIALIGNFFIIFSFFRNFKMRTITNTLVVNLSAADLLSSIFDFPFWLSIILGVPIYNNNILCRVLLSFEDLFQIVALLTMCGIALDRFVTLVKGLRRLMTHQRARFLILWSWVQAVISAAPWNMISQTESSRCLTFPHFYEPSLKFRTLNAFFKIASIVLPFLVTYYVFYRIVKAVRGRGKVNIDNNYVSRNYSAERFAVDAYKRSSKTAIILFLMFSLCSFPYLGVTIWTIVTTQPVSFDAGLIVYFVFTLKRSLFPAIYIFRNRVIWSFIQETVTCAGCRTLSNSHQPDALAYMTESGKICFPIFGRQLYHSRRIHPSVYDGENNYFPTNLELCFATNGKDVKALTDHFTDITRAEGEKRT